MKPIVLRPDYCAIGAGFSAWAALEGQKDVRGLAVGLLVFLALMSLNGRRSSS